MKRKLSDIFNKAPEPKEEEKASVKPPVEKKPIEEEKKGDKFFIMSSYGELLDIAIHLQDVEGKKVVMYITESEYKKIGDGIVEKAENWHDYLGQGWIFVIDGCEYAHLQDWLREQGENVVGTNKEMSELENNRQDGQEWFKSMGFKQPNSENFTDIDDALGHVKENKEKRFILKQNGSAPKSLNHMGKFENNEDMMYHLENLKKSWSESEYGNVDFDLMEVVEGVEVAASAFFNGHDWLRDSKGKVIGFLNFEHKKTHDGDLGSTCGEMGTLFFGCDETNPIFKDIIMKKGISDKLKETDYRGVFDINGCLTDKEYVAFEPTSRFGIPATSYEFIEGLKTPTTELLKAMAEGLDTPIDIVKGWGMVQVIVAKPFPVESDIEEKATSIGEKLWILQNGKTSSDFSNDQMKHIHLENFLKDENGDYKVATKNGYMLTVTGTGKSIEKIREDLLKYIKENIYISDMSYRQDLGKRIEKEL